MGYRILAEVIMVAHFAYLAYLVFGGFLAWRWRWTIWLHLLTVAWAAGSLAVGYECPLTHAENWAREQAGVAPLPPTGFIDYHLVGTIYPADAELQVQGLAALVVLASWVVFWALGRRRRRRRRSHRAGGAAPQRP